MDRAKLSMEYEANARTVTARIRWLMAAKGIKRERIIALFAGRRSARTINNWLSPAPPYPPFEEIGEIAKALRETTHYIITGKDAPTSAEKGQQAAFELEWLRANYLRMPPEERKIILELTAILAHHNASKEWIW